MKIVNDFLSKNEFNKRITKNGKPLHEDQFSFDICNKRFSCYEDELEIDFHDLNNMEVTLFGNNCKIKLGDDCYIVAEDKNIIEGGCNCYIVCGFNNEVYVSTGDIIVGDNCNVETTGHSLITFGKSCYINTYATSDNNSEIKFHSKTEFPS